MPRGDNQEGPYYMSSNLKKKKFDKTEGKTKEVDLTVDELTMSLRRIGVNTKGKRDNFEQETLLQHYAKELGVESDRSAKCHLEFLGKLQNLI